MTGSDSEPEVQIELEEDYQARKKVEDYLKNAYKNGGGTERQYNFASKRMIITNYKSLKSDKISTIQIDGKDKSVNLLATEKDKLTLHGVKQGFANVIKSTYLPKDFPDSVTKEYLPFTMYALIGGCCSAAMLFLSTQSLFVALGGSQSQA